MNDYRMFEGLGVATVAPFRADGTTLDYESLSRLTTHLTDNNVDFLVINGSTGESPCIHKNERQKLVDCVYEVTQGKIPIVMGLGSNDTQRVVERMQQMDTRHVDGILSVVPYYNKPTQEGIYQHFSALAKVSPLPIILYNIPGRTGMNMKSETTLRLAHSHPNIVGVKEASGLQEQVVDIMSGLERTDFRILSGDDNLSVPFIANGARGVISVIGNAYPKLFGNLIHKAMDGDIQEANDINLQLVQINKLLFNEGNPIGIKCLLHIMKLIDHNVLRLPLVPATEDLRQQMQAEHENLKKIYGNDL